ncbi:DUF4489 domain-containing protein [Clostridium paraputrificum]|uniref:DUF4489 domain-containing protein n=1 Tax=Clostridium paraputrificum TaxID=29363 RepID=UPI003D33D559
MNIMSDKERYDNDDCGCKEEREEKKCVIKCISHEGPKPGKAILKCGCGGGAPIPIVSLNILGTVKPLPLASVTIDTSNLKCPTTLLTFTAEITSVVDVALRLNFLIKKSSKSGCCEYICGTHSFSDVLEFFGTQSFSFQVCDCNPCDECVTYSVEYVPIDVVLAVGAHITNASLTAIAVENIC